MSYLRCKLHDIESRAPFQKSNKLPQRSPVPGSRNQVIGEEKDRSHTFCVECGPADHDVLERVSFGMRTICMNFNK